MKHTFLTLLIVFFTGCSKDSTTPTAATADQLPPATTTGANKAGCYINGELLVPKNNIPNIGSSISHGIEFYAGVNFSSTSGDDYFALEIANRRDNGGDYIYLHLPTLINGVGNYTVNQSNGLFFMDSANNPNVIVFTKDSNNNMKTYYSADNAGTISITRFDFPNRIYSGTFNLSVYNKDNPSEIIQITDGRFDINGHTLNQ